jgi:hypothetical protein
MTPELSMTNYYAEPEPEPAPPAPLVLPPPIPDEDEADTLAVAMDKPLRLSPDAIRALTKATGRTLTELLGDAEGEDEATRIQVLGFADLYRRYARLGHLPDAATIWEQAARAYIPFATSAAPPDPTEPES